MIDFTKIDYLKNGNERQKRAYEVLTKYKVLEKLEPYSPLLAGTIPIEIDIESSDLDIICEVDLRFEEDFLDDIAFSRLIPYDHDTDVKVENIMVNGEKSIVLNFLLDEFPVEIFGQNKPTTRQNAYLHMIAEYKILQEKGEEFKQKIIELKKQGIKTEPAFGMLLDLENPYEDLLKL
ncbi:DUF4269 domain-containing protein [Chryseobacterium lactis]|uniref:DUF4269 domain-containing protein n=1 Tax=Chryseobacterium lactis TaxID=1241981 RepID=A0A3G6RDB0_CHRLC|nr:DUF4269 domain-containing protein [Chryseobacterium lactis]AZA82650.1 DUF4269 domain-containing protein [Chryseobacterium lactis]AZB03032.1 DUF4269 domain-containing protein [Chryseobacterium lactis]PNW11829.1 DUF4269 domain-containing protein [Chryseobacterium lactis]